MGITAASNSDKKVFSNYRNTLKQDFNHVVFENHFKWITKKNPEEKKKSFKALEWLKKISKE
jgi:hypothetical protein